VPVDVFRDMNERQREAIAHLDGPLLVIAGAGSGKTRVITHRIANLIQHGTRPDRILAITFTNKAAGEMQERVERLLGIQTPWITTFHSAGLRILKLERDRTPFEHPFSVIDADDQLRLVKRVLKDMNCSPKEVNPKAVLGQVSRWKNRLLLPEEVDGADVGDETFLEAYRRYRAYTLEECLVDFDDLLLMPVRMFEEDDEIRERYRERFPYILIDEYQDTNQAQYRLVKLLGAHGNVCATGDPDQAIYGWRGADISNILSFERDFPGCRTVLLEQNYRSTRNVLHAAQHVIENNTERKDKTIFSENEEGSKIRLITVDDQDDEAMAISAACQRMHEQGRAYRDVAIFYRTNAQSRTLEDWLLRRELPYRIVGGTRFYDRREVRDLLAYLKLLVNPRDAISFERIVNVPRRGIGDKTLELLRELAGEEGVAPLEVVLDELLLDRVAVGRAARPLRDFARLWRRLLDADLRDPGRTVRTVIEETGLEPWHLENDEEQGQDRARNLREVISAAAQYHGSNPDAGVEGFLDHVALISSVDNRLAHGEDALILMTLHASKGLEFPVVFICGCEQGLLPLVRDPTTADYEEERRLMYVGITRTQKELYLSRAVLRTQIGQTRRNPPSMFLAEIPDRFIEHLDRATGEPASFGDRYREGPGYPERSRARRLVDDDALADSPEGLLQSGLLQTGSALKGALRVKGSGTGMGARRKPAEADDAPVVFDGDPFRPSQRLAHATFGEGTVRELTGPPDDRRIVIEFDQVGAKELLLRFAGPRLQAI